jgi:hypothetical protein
MELTAAKVARWVLALRAGIAQVYTTRQADGRF